MTRSKAVLTAALFLLCAGAAQAVPPAYLGPMGNPEEPALRPYKWMWHGLKSLAYQPADSFVRGNMNFPVIGTVEVGRGLRRGTFEMIESTYRGAIFSIPPRGKGSYKSLGSMNKYIEQDLLLRNTTDFAFTLYCYPVLKFVDHYPLEDDEKVDLRLQRARAVRAERKLMQDKRERDRLQVQIERTGDMVVVETRVDRAQKRYVPDRVGLGSQKRIKEGRGNLLRLAK